MPEDRFHFAIRVRLDGGVAFLLWYTDDRDGFVRDDNGRPLQDRSEERLKAKAAERGLRPLTDDVVHYDLDAIGAWCRSPRETEIDCPTFLNAWNLFDDLADIHGKPDSEFAALSRAASGRYDKLFWGNNVPAVTPPGERFDPAWEPEEVEEIRRVMEAGLTLFRESLRPA